MTLREVADSFKKYLLYVCTCVCGGGGGGHSPWHMESVLSYHMDPRGHTQVFRLSGKRLNY